MARKQPYIVVFAAQVKDHLQAVEKKYRFLIREKIDEQLQWEPAVQTRNRKPLRKPLLGAAWELRLGPDNRFRVLYGIDEDNRQSRFWRSASRMENGFWLAVKRWNHEESIS